MLKPVIAAQKKSVVFYSYTLPSAFARNELANAGVVALTGLTHVGVAMRRLVDYANFRLAPPAIRLMSPRRAPAAADYKKPSSC